MTAAFVQACGEDPLHWRQMWELAAVTSPAPEADGTARAVTSEESGDDPAAAARVEAAALRLFPGRVRLLVAAVLVMGVGAVVGLTAAFTAGGHGSSHASTATRPREPAKPLGTPAVAPSAPYPLRRFDTTTMRAGERITVDAPPGTPWPRATSGWVGYDLEFTLSRRQLVSVGTQTVGSSLAFIRQPTGTYPDCGQTHDDAGVVPTDSILPGTEFCVITNQRRRALIVIRAVHRDAAGLPDRVTLAIATWNHIIAPNS